MLKIRISGSKEELQLIAKHMGDGEIRKFKQPNGKTTYAIDTLISVDEFLAKNNINVTNQTDNIKIINQELNDILDIMDESD